MRVRTLLAAVLAAYAGSALAEPDLPMSRVDVVGTLPYVDAGIERDALPYTVQVLERDALRGARAERLTDAMSRNLNGVHVNDISGSPFQADITYRGQRASPILGTAQGLSVYLDGVRVNEPFGDVVNWDMLPEAAISRVTLVSGSNPLYGLNTLGGALALKTRSGLDESGFEAELSAGMAGRRRADLSYGARSASGWHGFAAATLFEDDGWRARSAGRLGNLFAKGGHAGVRTSWSASLLLGHSRLIGNGLLPSVRDDDGDMLPGLYEADRRAVYTFPDLSRNRLRHAAFELNQRLDQGLKLGVHAYLRASRRATTGGDVSDDYGDYVEDCGAGFTSGGSPADPAGCGLTRAEAAALHPASLNTTLTSQVGRGAGAVLHGARGAHQFDLGATFDRSRVSFAQFEQEAWFSAQREALADEEEARVPGSSVEGRSRAFAVYAFDTWAIAPATRLTASARLNVAHVANTLSTEDGPQAPEAFRYRKLNPSLGLTHGTGPLTWYANAAQSNRVPTVIELGCADPEQPCRLPVGLQSDPYLKQVVARTVEAGVRADWGSVQASLGAYRNLNRDDILFVGASASHAGYFANFDRTLRQGIELGVSGRTGSLRWRLDYSWLDAVYDADGTLFSGVRTVQVKPGMRIAGLPRHTLKLGLDWEAAQGLVLGADLQALSSVVTQGNEDGLIADPDPDDDEPARRADWSVRGYALLNLRASWRPAPGWELFARASNVLDRRYETYGMVAADLFPGGTLLRPHEAPGDASNARFVAPGAPRMLSAGLRYRF
jgi:outer membrane receptor protein involved in Fe transport